MHLAYTLSPNGNDKIVAPGPRIGFVLMTVSRRVRESTKPTDVDSVEVLQSNVLPIVVDVPED